MHVSGATKARASIGDFGWRRIVFMLVVGLVALFFASNLPYLLHPWVLIGDEGAQFPELHRWHGAQRGAGGLLSMGVLLALLWRPIEQPLLIQYVALSALITLLVVAPFIPEVVALIVVARGLVIAAYPRPRTILDFSMPGAPSRALLALTLAAACLMAPDAWRSLMWQIEGVGGEHASLFHWVDAFGVPLELVAAGLMAATLRPGWRVLGAVTGITYLYLGVAAATLPSQDGSWGIVGGALALVVGLAYVVIIWRAQPRARRPEAVLG
jgi:hypothetical protein